MAKPFTIVYVWRQSRLGASEGLNVLLTDLIRGLVECGIAVRLLTTGRHVAGLRDMLVMNHIAIENVEIVQLTQGSSSLALMYKWWESRKAATRRGPFDWRDFAGRCKAQVRKSVEMFLIWMLNFAVFDAPVKLMTGALAVVVTVFLLPLLIVLIVIYIVLRRILPPVAMRLRPRLAAVKGVVRSASVVEQLYRAECQRFGRAIDRDSRIDALFIPSAFEGHICAAVTRKPKLIVFPDATPLLFPTRFPGSAFADMLLASMRESVSRASGIICYSEFVRDQQLRRFFAEGSQGKPIEVIPQGFFVKDEFGERPDFSDNDLRYFVKNYFPQYGELPPTYFCEFSFIIYPTVDRPHKNTLTLLRAFEILLRDRGRNIKLVLTSPGGTEDTMLFIRERKLHRDVLFMPALPILVLNHLLERASVMVHPSLAEGGDIFNFSRAVSHGTPALLANIPVCREMFDRHGIDEAVYGDWLFEPTDYAFLCDRIDFLLSGHWQPLIGQQAALKAISKYGFPEMACRYSEAFHLLSDKTMGGVVTN